MKAQDIEITLEEALSRSPKWLQKKILHSVELLQKAEKLALRYDPEDGFFLAFSAGKDSQALYHVAKLAGVKFRAHINWTSVDPPQVVRFKRREYPEVVEKKPDWSIYDRAVQRGILPSMLIRWCCADFKETAGAGKVTLIGIRKEESTRRARRHEVEVSNKQFSGDLQQFEQWQERELQKREDKLRRKLKREKRKINEDEFSLMKENEVRCINGKDSILISPIFEWTEKDVWTFLNDVIGAKHCELYDQGYKRIGCILCPMSQHRQKMRELKDFPHVKRKWIEAIKAIRAGGITRKEYWTATSGGIFQPTEQQGMSAECSEIGNGITPPNGKSSGSIETERQWPSDGQRCSCSRTTFGSRYGMQFYKRQFTPPYAQMEQERQQRTLGGFSDSPSLNGIRGGANRADRGRNCRKDI